jgi:hypothetical protein
VVGGGFQVAAAGRAGAAALIAHAARPVQSAFGGVPVREPGVTLTLEHRSEFKRAHPECEIEACLAL